MIIDDVKVSCGCLKAEYPKQVVQADQDFEIKLTYDARQMGHFFKEAAVYSNGSKTPIYLTMKGIVVEEVTDYSGEYPYKIGDLRVDKTDLEFDDVNKGDRPSIVLHLINDGTIVLQPNIMHLPPYLEVTSSVEYLRPGHQGKLTVTLNSDKLKELKPAEKTTLKVTVEKEPFVKARTKPRILMITNDPNKPKIELKVEE